MIPGDPWAIGGESFGGRAAKHQLGPPSSAYWTQRRRFGPTSTVWLNLVGLAQSFQHHRPFVFLFEAPCRRKENFQHFIQLFSFSPLFFGLQLTATLFPGIKLHTYCHYPLSE